MIKKTLHLSKNDAKKLIKSEINYIVHNLLNIYISNFEDDEIDKYFKLVKEKLIDEYIEDFYYKLKDVNNVDIIVIGDRVVAKDDFSKIIKKNVLKKLTSLIEEINIRNKDSFYIEKPYFKISSKK